MRRAVVGLLGPLSLLLALFAPALAYAQATDPNVTPRPVSGSLAQIEAKRQKLLKQMLADPSNLDIAFEYAALSSEAGDLEGAISTLERMLIFAPGLPRLQLELGVLYFRLGAHEQAKSYFDAAVSGTDVPAEVREKVAAYQSAITEQSQGSSFEGAIMVGARVQSNANGATSASTVMLNGLPFVLNSNAKGQPDGNLFATGSFRYTHDLQSQGDRLIATLLTYGARYATQNTLDTVMFEATVGPELKGERFNVDDSTFGIYGIAGAVALGGVPYMLSAGLGGKFEKELDGQTQIALTSEYRYESFQNSTLRPTAANRTGHRLRVVGSAEYQVNDDLNIFAMLTGERRIASVGYMSAMEFGATVGATLMFPSPIAQLTEPWSATVQISYAQRRFDAADPLISATVAEVDHELTVQGSLVVPVKEGWSVQSSAGYRNIISNYTLSTADNFWLQVGVMKQF